MKNLFALIALHLLLVGSICAQSIQEGLQKDSLELAYKIAILKLQKANADLQKEIDNQPKVDQKAEAAAQKAEKLADFNDKIAKLTAQKELLGDAKPTPLTGSVTIDAGTISMAETRALVYQSLDKLIGKFVKDINTKTAAQRTNSTSEVKNKIEGSESPCGQLGCDSSAIIIYHPTYYQAFSDYDALLKELGRLKKNYEVLTKKIRTNATASVVGAVALGTQALNVLMSAAELFRSETEFKVTDEGIDEDLLASMIRQQDTCCRRSYLYPALYLPTNVTASPLIDTLARLDSVRIALDETTTALIKAAGESTKTIQTDLTNSKKKLEQNNADLKKAKEALAKLKGDARTAKENEIDKIVQRQDTIQMKIKGDSTTLANKLTKDSGIIKAAEVAQKALDEQYNGAMLALRSPVEEGSKISLLRQFLRVEKLLDVVRKPNAYTLRVVAQGKGTNRIRKFLWATSLKHSAGVEARYQLFDNEAIMVKAAAALTYTRYRRSRYINRKLQ